MHTNRYLLLALSGLAVLTACSATDAGTAPGAQAQLSLSVASRARTGAGASMASLDVTSPSPGTFTDGTNTLTLTSVQVVLRKIELERAGHDGACAAGTGGDSCEELEAGPVLFNVPVATVGAQHTVSVNLDAGTFEKVEFEIHKPEDTGDAAFLAANPSFAGVSIRVEGTWNGTPFTFTSDLDAEQELELSPPLVVAQSGATDLTLFFDVSSWFKTSSGTLIDPASAVKGQPNDAVVQNNIKLSLRAFEDDNEDGAED
jgi:hypothetical protein